ncbi:hypothetical protein PAPYR_4683 [Paratrimastix pyriformis]|uniref:Protein-S-isoprenylcysteine O-methyltransferase n=1 Tax=Paratrimastix pyriformis TaxID=342808 RepID=A0ABQ8UPW8_9EUKA|nr:hypothetical protein PAPYR_4683 [Paratrimastix pyriformis]
MDALIRFRELSRLPLLMYNTFFTVFFFVLFIRAYTISTTPFTTAIQTDNPIEFTLDRSHKYRIRALYYLCFLVPSYLLMLLFEPSPSWWASLSTLLPALNFPVAKWLALPQIQFIAGLFMVFFGITLLGLGVLEAGVETLSARRTTPLICSGIYAQCRHPQFFGLWLVLVGIATLGNSTIMMGMAVLIVAPAFGILMRLQEEQDLIRRFRAPYCIYCRLVPACWPHCLGGSLLHSSQRGPVPHVPSRPSRFWADTKFRRCPRPDFTEIAQAIAYYDRMNDRAEAEEEEEDALQQRAGDGAAAAGLRGAVEAAERAEQRLAGWNEAVIDAGTTDVNRDAIAALHQMESSLLAPTPSSSSSVMMMVPQTQPQPLQRSQSPTGHVTISPVPMSGPVGISPAPGSELRISSQHRPQPEGPAVTPPPQSSLPPSGQGQLPPGSAVNAAILQPQQRGPGILSTPAPALTTPTGGSGAPRPTRVASPTGPEGVPDLTRPPLQQPGPAGGIDNAESTPEMSTKPPGALPPLPRPGGKPVAPPGRTRSGRRATLSAATATPLAPLTYELRHRGGPPSIEAAGYTVTPPMRGPERRTIPPPPA